MVSSSSSSSSSSYASSSSAVAVAAAPKIERARNYWTADEDNILIEYVKKNGANKWNMVAVNSGLFKKKKTGNSCRMRWTNHLKPGINTGHFTEDEDATIIHFRNVYGGNKWSEIAGELPGRNDNQVKNRWFTYLSKKNAESIPQHSDQVLQVDDAKLIEFSDIFAQADLDAIIGYINNEPLPDKPFPRDGSF